MQMTRKMITGVAANFIFNRFFGYILFTSFLLFIFFSAVLFVFGIKIMYSDTHSTMRAGE